MDPYIAGAQLIGKGAFGSVYRDGDIAIKKICKDEYGEREAKVLYQISQIPRIERYATRIHDIKKSDVYKCFYIYMDFIDGDSLESQIRTMDCTQVMDTMIHLLNGLALIHNTGIVHRDIKPDNIVVDENGLPKYIDFGLACFINDPECLERAEGTPSYMSPERIRQVTGDIKSDIWALGVAFYRMMSSERIRQVTGDIDQKNVKSDIWALGVVFYRMLNYGMLPFFGKDTTSYFRSVLMNQVVSDSDCENLDSIVEAMLEKDYLLRPTIPELIQMIKEAKQSHQ